MEKKSILLVIFTITLYLAAVVNGLIITEDTVIDIGNKNETGPIYVYDTPPDHTVVDYLSGYTTSYYAYDQSVLNHEGGHIGYHYGYSNSTLNFWGGIIELPEAYENSIFNFYNGLLFSAGAYNSATINVIGTDYIFEGNIHNDAKFNQYSGTSYVVAYDNSKVNIHGGTCTVSANDNAMAEIWGGSGWAGAEDDDSEINIHDCSGLSVESSGGLVNIFGGNLISDTIFNSVGLINIHGGGHELVSSFLGTINIFDGAINGFELHDNSDAIINLYGGDIDAALSTYISIEHGTMNIFGYEFQFDPLGNPSNSNDPAFLSGYLSDNTPFRIYLTEEEYNTNIVLHEIPEPYSFSLLLMGGLALRRRGLRGRRD